MSQGDASFRTNWRRNWLHCLYEFASPNLQRMSWVEGPRAKWPDGEMWVSSFDECYCTYFDDLVLDEWLGFARSQGLISESEVSLSVEFHELADKYDEFNYPRKILSDPAWHMVVRKAALLWSQLKFQVSEEELAEMLRLEEKYGRILDDPIHEEGGI